MNSSKFILMIALIASLFISTFATVSVTDAATTEEYVMSTDEELANSVGLGNNDGLGAWIQLNAAGFAHIRNNLFGGTLTQTQVNNINSIMAACNQHGITDIRQAAYILATAKHETGNLLPVREAYWLPESYRQTLRYYPYYGRGYVQLTWRENYQKADNILGLGGRLMANLDLALDGGIAAQVIVRGMKDSWFTGVGLNNYINGGNCDYYNARRIVNGLDKAQLIANYAVICEQAFRK